MIDQKPIISVSAKSSWFVNFHSKAISKWRTYPLRTRCMTYPSLSVGDFGYRSQIIFRGVAQRQFPVCSQKGRGLTLPKMKYFEILTHHYAWSNKELKEFPTSFASSKTSYFIRFFGMLTSDAGIFRQEILCCLLEVSCPIRNLIVWQLAFRARSVLENFEKQASGVSAGTRQLWLTRMTHKCSIKVVLM